MIAIVFLTIEPHHILINFAKKLIRDNYDIYVCVDDNDCILTDTDTLKYIRYPHDYCLQFGYKGLMFEHMVNRPSAWDKSIYFFSEVNKTYDYVWFIEYDVFVPTEDTIYNIDNKYPDADLLCEANNIKYSKPNDWHWYLVNGLIELPWSHGMMCACRMSPKLLAGISAYVSKNKRLFFLEAMFPTIALHNSLNIVTPVELSSIIYRCDWKQTDIIPSRLYHPIKDITLQEKYRVGLSRSHKQ